MKSINAIIIVFSVNLFFWAGIFAHDDIRYSLYKIEAKNMKEGRGVTKDGELGSWERQRNYFKESWEQDKEKEIREWIELKNKIELKWLDCVTSTKRTWVEYNKAIDTRSKVDFKAGKIVVETAVPVQEPEPEKKAKLKIARHLEWILGGENDLKKKILDKQIADKQGKIVKDNKLNKFITDEILPSVKPESKVYKAKDNVIRKKYTATIAMVPNHLRIRASKYVPLVQENAREFQLSPQLIMAIIHTESYFNPLAVSTCGAIGLMQIIPEQAGREAYSYLFGKDKIVTREYLYDPHHNIRLGSAYLYLLKNIHFNEVKDPIKKRYVSICGYNWGPTAVRDKILKHYSLDKLSRLELYDLLNKNVPRETRFYLQNVNKRITLYDPLFI